MLIVSRQYLIWEMDLMTIHIDNNGGIYFTPYVDRTSRMLRTGEMIEEFENAILSTFPGLNTSGLIMRSDNDSQLTS